MQLQGLIIIVVAASVFEKETNADIQLNAIG